MRYRDMIIGNSKSQAVAFSLEEFEYEYKRLVSFTLPKYGSKVLQISEEGFIKSVKDTVIKIWKWIVEKCKQFWNWIKGLFGGSEEKTLTAAVEEAKTEVIVDTVETLPEEESAQVVKEVEEIKEDLANAEVVVTNDNGNTKTVKLIEVVEKKEPELAKKIKTRTKNKTAKSKADIKQVVSFVKKVGGLIKWPRNAKSNTVSNADKKVVESIAKAEFTAKHVFAINSVLNVARGGYQKEVMGLLDNVYQRLVEIEGGKSSKNETFKDDISRYISSHPLDIPVFDAENDGIKYLRSVVKENSNTSVGHYAVVEEDKELITVNEHVIKDIINRHEHLDKVFKEFFHLSKKWGDELRSISEKLSAEMEHITSKVDSIPGTDPHYGIIILAYNLVSSMKLHEVVKTLISTYATICTGYIDLGKQIKLSVKK